MKGLRVDGLARLGKMDVHEVPGTDGLCFGRSELEQELVPFKAGHGPKLGQPLEEFAQRPAAH